MAGWDAYIDNLIGHCAGACDAATIIGKEGGAYWTSQDANAGKFVILSPEEAKKIADNMGLNLGERDPHPFATTGIILNGQKYRFLRFENDEDLILGKLKDNGAISIQGCNTCVVLAHTKEGANQGSTNKGMAVIVEYLKGMNM